MISQRLILFTTLLAGFGTACTAIVLGKVGETGDYKTVPSLSSSSSGEIDECSILKDRNANLEHDANACSTCITDNCASDLTYACNRGKQEKPWFQEMKSCAQKPWNGFSPPSEGSSYVSYGCKAYEKTKETVSDNGSDTQREPEAHNCINNKCLQGALPACKQCEVHIRKSEAEPAEALLRDDDCGKCLVENCQATLVQCCDTPGMQDFVEHCAFTKTTENMALCKELGNAVPDSGERRSYDDAGVQCLNALSACFTSHCKDLQECK